MSRRTAISNLVATSRHCLNPTSLHINQSQSILAAISVNTNNNDINTANYILTSKFSSAAATSSSNGSNNNSSNYQSPYSSYFNRIKTNAPSPLTGASSPSSSPSPVLLKCGIPESTLKFKTTSYGRLMLPPYVQPGEYKVILKVYGRDLPLTTELEKQIFAQVVGRRYNAERDELKLTSDQFASRIENKRHLCSMLDRIVLGAKRLAKEIDDSSSSSSSSTSSPTQSA